MISRRNHPLNITTCRLEFHLPPPNFGHHLTFANRCLWSSYGYHHKAKAKTASVKTLAKTIFSRHHLAEIQNPPPGPVAVKIDPLDEVEVGDLA